MTFTPLTVDTRGLVYDDCYCHLLQNSHCNDPIEENLCHIVSELISDERRRYKCDTEGCIGKNIRGFRCLACYEPENFNKI